MAAQCGGCAWIGSPYGEQLERKRQIVVDALATQAPLADTAVEPCIGAPVTAAYRNRAKLAVGVEAGRVRLGLYQRGTNRITDLAPCRVQRPAVQAAIETLRVWLGRHRLASPSGPVFYVDLRETATGGCHLTFVIDRRRAEADLPLADLRQSWPGLAGIAVNHGDRESSYPIGLQTRIISGPRWFEIALERGERDPLVFEVPPAGFFQVLPAALGPIHRLMTAYLGVAGGLLDLYCGVGVHGIAIAHDAGVPVPWLVGVEESSALVEAARRNAERVGVAATFVAERVEEVAGDLLEERRPARVILNPGRSGVRADVSDALARSGARIAYLSCNPTTLARDLARLVTAGCRLDRVIPVDLMPQTDHVEALALLEAPALQVRP